MVLEISNPKHRVKPEQMTERKDNLGVAACVSSVLPNLENRIVRRLSSQTPRCSNE